ncbi:ubiquitin-like protein smt3 [Chrysochromulina tobinii]|uniref:Ubiquitin-like protein smt3 n=1 Tax=Chrysochromulina tobinii TaxID=1460289 RepID=A0A0M0K3S7_9EUKA|nr:ubiquitin-like protein smt3 [Chrysochromulina tobinii]|eukprot:KOO33272.1 ubiquitin-like protein smt3 [Chrysochromulina sp. CCMP291]
MADEESKQGEEAKPNTMQLKVVSQDGTEVFFKCKPDTKLEKLMRAFCQRQGVAMESVRFLFDGNRIRENQTPNELEMEDGDSIDVVVAQVGGTPTTR